VCVCVCYKWDERERERTRGKRGSEVSGSIINVCTVLTSCAKINARTHKKVKLMHTGVMVWVGNGCKDGVAVS